MYIISGPAGVGKSTTAKRLAHQLEESAYIEGDVIYGMVVGGYLPPWESEASLTLAWKNIADLSINFLKANKNVVIDYVAFPEEVERLSKMVWSKVADAEIVYVTLMVEPDELLRRDALRIKEHQMGERCIELVKEFQEKQVDKRFIYNTTNLKPADLDSILENIKENRRFHLRKGE
ncbi:AAA family ATPase [Evansella cellulosilytica]|nr:AAA family ATPase [Evansella cellulosilytica]